jgi:hypothetical protein
MHSKTHARALAIVDQCLRHGPWRESPWDERSRRFGNALLTSLRESLATLQPMTAVSAACNAARGELPLASAVFHETWSRAVMVWAVREVVRAAHNESDAATRDELVRLASELAAATAQLSSVDGSVATAQLPFEQMVDAAREAFNRTREALPISADEKVFLNAYVHQLKHIASLLAVGGHSVDSLVRGAVSRTDRAVRRDGIAAWIDAPLTVRQTWMQRGLAEASWALASQVSREQGRNDNSRDICLWLARTACQLMARIDRIDAWVPTTEADASNLAPVAIPVASPVAAPVTAAPPTTHSASAEAVSAQKTTEKKMDTPKLNPMLKTLEVDATEAAWRMAGSQFVKLAKEPIVALLSRHLGPGDESLRGRIAAFLDTELGTAILSGVLSAGLSAMPLPSNDISQRLSRELRVRSMAATGDVIADVLMGPLRQVAVMYLQGQPGASASDPAALPANALVDALKIANTPVAETVESPAEPKIA